MKNTKLYILTGFLGSGKTTVLLKLCRQLKDSRVGVSEAHMDKSTCFHMRLTPQGRFRRPD